MACAEEIRKRYSDRNRVRTLAKACAEMLGETQILWKQEDGMWKFEPLTDNNMGKALELITP